MKAVTLATLVAAVAFAGCSLAPKYTRPQAPIPAAWPEAAADGADINAPQAAEVGWRQFYLDDRLRSVIALSLANNRDLRIATLNIDRAQAAYRIHRADQFPTIQAAASAAAQRTPVSLSPTGHAVTTEEYRVGPGFASYELDLFGRVRNLKEQALQEYLAIAETRRSAQISLVAEVAAAWMTTDSDAAELKLAQETYQTRRRSLELTQRSNELGVASALDVDRARASVETARGNVASFTRQVALDRNALQLLVGSPVANVLFPDASRPPVAPLADLPAGVESAVLLQRPDIVAAEHRLIGGHASIGAARAAYFPSISLTAFAGTASDSLSGLFGGGSGMWTFVPQVTQTIFDSGRTRERIRVAETDRGILVAEYEKAIQIAFREVADALAARGTIAEQLAAQQALVDATQRAYDLTETRYRNGIDSSLSLLDAQRELYSAQQGLLATQLARETNLVSLYRALGGGWSE